VKYKEKIMAKLTSDELIEAFKELTLIELSEFVKKFEEVFEVTAAAPVAVAAAGGAAAVAEEVEEKDSFDVVLEAAGEKKIQVIKEVRALTSLGLGEAKAVVDGAPGVVLEGVNKETADKAKAQLAQPSPSSSRRPSPGTTTCGVRRHSRMRDRGVLFQ
jgi:large subunit ribosomal protein L7/L12